MQNPSTMKTAIFGELSAVRYGPYEILFSGVEHCAVGSEDQLNHLVDLRRRQVV
jgi:hypothetical protein